MRTLNSQEKRTVRIAAIVLVLFFIWLGGSGAWGFLQGRRNEYNKLVLEAKDLQAELVPYGTKVQTATKLMEAFKLDPFKLKRATVVADASAAIQKAAMTGGIQLGPIRESPARTAAKELTSIQMDGSGQVQAVMTFLAGFESLGFPLILDSVQITSDPQKPQMIKVHLNIVIMDFEQWKSEERPNA